MNRLELRGEVGNRTYDAGMRLLKADAVSAEKKIDDTLCLYLVRDKPARHVAVWNRKGAIAVECGCTPKAMGCRHCAAVCLSMSDDWDERSYVDEVRRAIEELKGISFDPVDYIDEVSQKVLMTMFYDFIQKRIDKTIAVLCGGIGEVQDPSERESLYRMLWDATRGFESPHDDWSGDAIMANGGMAFRDGDDRTLGRDPALARRRAPSPTVCRGRSTCCGTSPP